MDNMPKTFFGMLFYNVSVAGLGIVMAFLLINYTPVAYEYTMEQLEDRGYIDR